MKIAKLLIACSILLGVVISCGIFRKEVKKEITEHSVEKDNSGGKKKYDVNYGLPYFASDSVNVLIPVYLNEIESGDIIEKVRDEFDRISSNENGNSRSDEGLFRRDINNIVIYNRDSLSTKILLADSVVINSVNCYEFQEKLYLIFSTKEQTDEKDADYSETLFFTGIDSINIKQISPDNVRLSGYRIFADRDEIYIFYRRDTNNDNKFNGQDKLEISRLKFSNLSPARL